MPGRKRIHVPADSSGDEASPKKESEISVKEKEALLIKLRNSAPDYDTMV